MFIKLKRINNEIKTKLNLQLLSIQQIKEVELRSCKQQIHMMLHPIIYQIKLIYSIKGLCRNLHQADGFHLKKILKKVNNLLGNQAGPLIP
jgi:hypothetical protein